MTNIISSAPGVVPEGVTFGDKVLVVPPLGGRFCHSGQLIGLTKIVSYQWIKRDECIAKYIIRTPTKCRVPIIKDFFEDDENVSYITSPASGLIIHGGYDTRGSVDLPDDPPDAYFAILLPDDEHPPEKGDVIFSDVCNLVKEHQDLFFKPSRYASIATIYDKDSLKKFLDRQKNSICREYNALPHWADYFKHMRTKFPALRPLLKHLV